MTAGAVLPATSGLVGDGGTPAPRARRWARRLVVLAVVGLQLGLVVRGYSSDHREFGFQMFSEASDWRADVVRVTADGRRVPIEEEWSGYRWADLVTSRGLATPAVRHHADSSARSQVAFLQAALDWVAAHTPRDTETRYLEAAVETWPNGRAREVQVVRSPPRTP